MLAEDVDEVAAGLVRSTGAGAAPGVTDEEAGVSCWAAPLFCWGAFSDSTRTRVGVEAGVSRWVGVVAEGVAAGAPTVSVPAARGERSLDDSGPDPSSRAVFGSLVLSGAADGSAVFSGGVGVAAVEASAVEASVVDGLAVFSGVVEASAVGGSAVVARLSSGARVGGSGAAFPSRAVVGAPVGAGTAAPALRVPPGASGFSDTMGEASAAVGLVMSQSAKAAPTPRR